MRERNKEAVDACLTYIKKSSEYTIKKVLTQHNFWVNVETKSEGRHVLSCPFHSDSSPSFNVLEDLDQYWRCFSCSRSGRAMELIVELNKNVLRSDASFYQILNNLLANDIAMKATTGFVSIYKLARDSKSEGVYVRKKFVPVQERELKNYLQLSREMVKLGLTSREQRNLAILYMQNEMNPNEILKHLKGIRTEVVETGTESFFDLTGLLTQGYNG